jgi:sec-independent protein translocase protein TatA
MLGLRMPELLLILLVVVLLFGAKKLPELGESLGKGIRAFKKAAEHGFGGDDASAAAPKPQQEQLPQGTPSTPASTEATKQQSPRGGGA